MSLLECVSETSVSLSTKLPQSIDGKKSKRFINEDLLLRREGRRSRLLTDDTADRECDQNGNSQQ